jgi:NTP pyrophosphatase (non-canonical NTP hydrolase)
MELSALSARALQLRERFAELERARQGRPWTREEIMQGFVVDVGDLMKLVMAKSGARSVADLDARLAHELADCLWSVLVLAQLYEVDLESAFLDTMTELDAKLEAQIAAARASSTQ